MTMVQVKADLYTIDFNHVVTRYSEFQEAGNFNTSTILTPGNEEARWLSATNHDDKSIFATGGA